MTDQDSFEDPFDTPTIFDESIEGESPVSRLKVLLETTNPTFEEERWQQLLEKSWTACKRELLDENVFSQILPVAHSSLCRILKQVDTLLTDTTVSGTLSNLSFILKDKLFNCEGILHLFQKSVEHVSNFKKVSIEYVKSLPDTLPSSIKLVFDHCKASSQTYGELFQDLSKELMSLFRKANGTYKLFLTVLEDVIIFNTTVESEIGSLLNVLKVLGAIAASAHGLDLKTFVGSTTIFAKLALAHRDIIKTTSPANIITSIQLIAKETNSLYSTILDSNGKKEEKTLKGASIMLKVITKLTSAYCKYLSKDVLLTLIDLLSCLHRYSASLIDGGTIDTLNNSILSGTDLLLSTLLMNGDFNKAYFEYSLNKDIDKLGFHLLTLAISKAIPSMQGQEYSKWIVGQQSILDVVFTNIDSLHDELCIGEVQLSGSYNFEGKTEPIDLYTATLMSICKLIVLVSCENFNVLERLLLKNLLSGSFWCSLLSSDVWYFIGRYGSSQLCISHVKYLMHVYAALIERRDALEVCVLKNLIGRLLNLLTENDKHSMVIEWNDIDAYLWTPFARFLPCKTRSILSERLGVPNVSNTVENFFQQPSTRHWFNLMKVLPAANKFSNTTETMLDVITKLWNFISSTIEGCDHRNLFILSDFATSVLDGTHHDFVYQDAIINAISNFSLHALPHAKLKIAYYLEDLAANFKNDQSKASNAFAELNCKLLDDENPWVRQDTLESFDRLAHTCPNEDLVAKIANAISRKSTIRESVPAYLSNARYYKLQDVRDVKSYLYGLTRDSMNGNARHVCMLFKDSKKDVKIPRMEAAPLEKIKCENTSKELDERVNRICEELNCILKRKSDIGDVALKNLRAALARLTE